MSIQQLAWNWLRLVWRNPLLFAAAVLCGAVVSFAYSYVPLQASKDWKIAYLEERLDQQNAQIAELQEQLAASAADAARRPEPGEFEALRAEFEQAQRELAGQRASAKRAERSARSLRKSRDRWRSKHAAVVAELASRPAAPEPAAAGDFPADPALSAAGDSELPAAGLAAQLPEGASPAAAEPEPETPPAAPEP